MLHEEDQRALSVYCTLCLARPGERCHNDHGPLERTVHVARLDNYQRLKERDRRVTGETR